MAGAIVTTARQVVVAAIIAIALLALTLPVQAATPAEPRPGDDGWAARQIRKGGIPQRDRKLVSGLPGRSKIGYHPETGRVRMISGTPGKPLGAALESHLGRRNVAMAVTVCLDHRTHCGRSHCRRDGGNIPPDCLQIHLYVRRSQINSPTA